MNLDIDERIASELTRHAPFVNEYLAWEQIQSGATVRKRRRAITMVASSIAVVAVLALGVSLAPNLLSREADSAVVGQGSSAGEVMRTRGEVLTVTDHGEGIGDLVAVDPVSGDRRLLVQNVDDISRARWSADGRWVAYVSRGGLWVVDSTAEPREVLAHIDDPQLWAWSSTGARIAVVDDSTLVVMDAASGRITAFTVTARTEDNFLQAYESLTFPPTWSPDDTAIVVGARGGTLYAIDANTGDHSVLVQLEGRQIDSVDVLAWSPDGGHLGVLVDFGSYSPLLVVDADGSDVRQLATTTPNNDRITAFAWSPDGSRIAYVIQGEAGLRLVVARADGSATPRARTIHTDWANAYSAPVWSPDGQQIAVGGLAGQLEADADNVVIDADASGEFAPLDDRTYESWRGGGYEACGRGLFDWC